MGAPLSPARLAGRTISGANHICAFFSSKEEQYKVLMPFFKSGFEQGEKLFHIVDGRLHDDHRCACHSGGIDVAAAEDSTQLAISDWETTYLKDGYFDSDRMIAALGDMLEESRARFPRVRVTGNMEWALERAPGVEDIIEYETKLNLVLPHYTDVFVCVYDMNKHSGAVVMDILRTHPMIIIAGVLQENPLYVPPNEFLQQLQQRKAGLDQGATAAASSLQ